MSVAEAGRSTRARLPHRWSCWAWLIGAAALVASCHSRQETSEDDRAASSARRDAGAPATASSGAAASGPPALLYLPSEAERLPPPIGDGLLPGAPPLSRGRCGEDMVDIRGQFCIDRYEVSLIDQRTKQPLSPHYHPTRAQTLATYERYRNRDAQVDIAVPQPPDVELNGDFTPEARSVKGQLPQGYLSDDLAEQVCRAAGKRLCTRAEWVIACRGQQNRKFPYGDEYVEGACNVFREGHPAAILHGDASREHLDPRLLLVTTERGPLLRVTGATPSCRSEWGADAVFDMVGNLDEWVAEGSFLGGFFSRGTRDGCDARIASHPPQYFDYSLGTRCCR